MGKTKMKIVLILIIIMIAVPSLAVGENSINNIWNNIREGIFRGMLKGNELIRKFIEYVKNPEGEEKTPINPDITAEFNKTILDCFGNVSIKYLKDIDNANYFSVIFKYSDGISEDEVGPVGIDEKTTEIFYNEEFPVTIIVYGKDLNVPLKTYENVYLEVSE